jgi:hypothetical protein
MRIPIEATAREPTGRTLGGVPEAATRRRRAHSSEAIARLEAGAGWSAGD